MYNIGDYVVYKREVCEIVDIKEKYIKDKDYYRMRNIRDKSLVINIPIDSDLIRSVMSKGEALDIIDKIVDIDIDVSNEQNIENIYKELMKTEKIEDLIKIIKISYKRCEDRVKQGKKISEKDDNYFKKCEEIFYTEMSVALNMSYDDTVNYIKTRIESYN